AQRMALKAGTDTLEHMVFHDDETIEMICEAGVPVTPTLSHRTDHAIELRRAHGTAEFVLRKMKYLQPFCFESFQKMYKAGVKIAMGTDMGFEPDMGSNGAELEIFVKLGMEPMDAILSATRNAAQAIKLDTELGTIEVGKLVTGVDMAARKSVSKTKTQGAIKGGESKYHYPLTQLKRIPAGTGYSTAEGGVVEGERMLVGYIHKARGTGSRMHSHKNEQFNYV